MKRKRNIRLLITFTLIIAIFLALIINVFVVSIKGYHINSKTNIKDEVKDIHTVKEPIIAKRGRILDYQNDVLVEDNSAYTLYAYIGEDRFDGDKPAFVIDKEDAAKKIADVIKEDYDYVYAQLTSDSKQVEFGSKGKYLSSTQKEKLEGYEIPGLGFKHVLLREQYSSSLGSTLIGLTSFDEEINQQVGIMGVEKYYNDVLTGTNGLEVYRQDRDLFRFDSIDQLSVEASDGKDIRLTIDKIVQSSLDNALNNLRTNKRVLAKEAWGGLIDIETGRILAIADAPAFDAEDPDTLYINRATEYEYEPGSTMKTLTYAMALNEGKIRPDDTYDSSPYYVSIDANNEGERVSSGSSYTEVIQNPFNHNYGTITMLEGYQRSSNVMIADIMAKYLIDEAFPRYMRDLGFYEAVNIGEIPEASGQEVWQYYHEKLTNGFGQGSTVTMLQLLQAHTAVFGDGTIVKPYIIESILDPDTKEPIYQAEVTKSKPVFTQETAQLVRDAMHDNVENQAFGMGRFKMNDVHVMAKSGTSEIVIDGEYSKDEYIFSAMLGFPYENPKYALYFAYRTFDFHPNTEVADEMKNVIKTVISNYPIDTMEHVEKETPVQKTALRNYINQDINTTSNELKELGYTPIILGEGKTIIGQYPKHKSEILNTEKILLKTNGDDILMPNIKGWSAKEVSELSEFLAIEIEIKGSGFVTKQSVTPNTKLKKDQKITVNLK